MNIGSTFLLLSLGICMSALTSFSVKNAKELMLCQRCIDIFNLHFSNPYFVYFDIMKQFVVQLKLFGLSIKPMVLNTFGTTVWQSR